MTEPFDPHHRRYYHALCLDAHVTKAAKYVAFVSLFFTLLVSVSSWIVDQGTFFRVQMLINTAVVIGLLFAVIKEHKYLTIPYLLCQAFNIGIILTMVFNLLTNQRIMPFQDQYLTHEDATGYSVLFATLAAILLYFCKVILNFFLFLYRREKAESLGILIPAIHLVKNKAHHQLTQNGSFDPYAAQYYHTICVGAHVTKAVRFVAFISAAFVVVQTATLYAMQSHQRPLITFAEVLVSSFSIATLLIAIYREIAFLVFPYLIILMWDCIGVIYSFNLSVLRDLLFASPFNNTVSIHLTMTPSGGLIETKVVQIFKVCYVLINVPVLYFCKIVVNYFLFITRRNAAKASDRKFLTIDHPSKIVTDSFSPGHKLA